MSAILQRIKKDLVNLPGWRTPRKIVVIESDDWGTVSLPSKATLEALLAAGLPVPTHAFARYDTLESDADFAALYQVLNKHRDQHDNPACITTCTVVGNPDFARIKAADFQAYFYEPFTTTYERYPQRARALELLREGIDAGYVYPQLHGREHINPFEWLRVLQTGDEQERLLFEHETLMGIPGKKKLSKRFNGYFAAFDFEMETELAKFADVIREGQQLFEDIFGFKSTSFVAPTGIRSDRMDAFLAREGIQYHQLGQQFLPYEEVRYAIRHRFLGASNSEGQLYWRRNGFFEPARDRDRDWIGPCLREMNSAFRTSKPFVISSHRVNYVGGIDPANREFGLQQLDQLLAAMLKAYPDIEFMNSAQLGEEMRSNPNYFLGMKFKDFYYDQKFTPK